MTNASDDTPRPGEMTDEQLDQVLKAASTNLLHRITAAADPSRALTAIMGRADQHAPAETPVSTMIRLRDIAHDIASALALASTSADEIERAHSLASSLGSALIPDLASDPVRVLERTHDLGRTRKLVRNLASEITRGRHGEIPFACNGTSDLVRIRVGDRDLNLGGDVAHDLGRAADIALARALDHARAIAQDLDSYELDASGEDLSGIEIRHLDE